MQSNPPAPSRFLSRVVITGFVMLAAAAFTAAPLGFAFATDDPPPANGNTAKPADNDNANASGSTPSKSNAGGDSSTKRSDANTSDTKNAKSSARDPEPRREPSYSEILKELQEESRKESRGVVHSGVPGKTAQKVQLPAGNAIAPPSERLLPDGSRLVDRPGRLTRDGDHFVYSFESRSEGATERPIRLLPNRLLEDMEMYSENGLKPIVFIVSGEVTEYHGQNYLLIQKLLVRPDTGNIR